MISKYPSAATGEVTISLWTSGFVSVEGIDLRSLDVVTELPFNQSTSNGVSLDEDILPNGPRKPLLMLRKSKFCNGRDEQNAEYLNKFPVAKTINTENKLFLSI